MRESFTRLISSAAKNGTSWKLSAAIILTVGSSVLLYVGYKMKLKKYIIRKDYVLG